MLTARGWLAGMVMFLIFALWGWFTQDVMHWSMNAFIAGGIVLLLSAIALGALHTEG